MKFWVYVIFYDSWLLVPH